MQLGLKEKLQIISIILIIGFGVAQLILAWPAPKLEVNLLEPRGKYSWWEFGVENATSIPPVTTEKSHGTGANLTFVIFNSGKGVAYGVVVELVSEPANICEVTTGYVFAGKPVATNFLTKTETKNMYYWGTLGVGESFSITFTVEFYSDTIDEILNREKQPKLLLNVTSENTQNIIFEVPIG